ncbi:MAG: hypothetical protein ACM3X0_13615 [Bacteroidota bacterium]
MIKKQFAVLILSVVTASCAVPSSDHPSSESAAAANAAVESRAAFSGLGKGYVPIPDRQVMKNYNDLVGGLAKRKMLIDHEWNMYVPGDKGFQSFTDSSIDGMAALRNMLPEDLERKQAFLKSSGLLFQWKPVVLFMKDGSGFFVRKDHFAKGPDPWAVYDAKLGIYRMGADAQPYIQKMLAAMDTTALPKTGADKPTFILYTSPSCPYSAKVEPLLEKSFLNYRTFPTYTINPGQDIPYVHKIFCSKNPRSTLTSILKTARPLPKLEFKECDPNIMPVYTLGDLDMIFGEGYPTPSYYFADGTVISGADKVDLVKKKSKEMADMGLFFK